MPGRFLTTEGGAGAGGAVVGGSADAADAAAPAALVDGATREAVRDPCPPVHPDSARQAASRAALTIRGEGTSAMLGRRPTVRCAVPAPARVNALPILMFRSPSKEQAPWSSTPTATANAVRPTPRGGRPPYPLATASSTLSPGPRRRVLRGSSTCSPADRLLSPPRQPCSGTTMRCTSASGRRS